MSLPVCHCLHDELIEIDSLPNMACVPDMAALYGMPA